MLWHAGSTPLEHTEMKNMDPGTGALLYLDLMKKCLTRLVFEEKYAPIRPPKLPLRRALWSLIPRLLATGGFELVRKAKFDAARRAIGRDLPAEAETMIGIERLDNLQHCVTDVIRQGVPGDLIETGVWRGGSTIFMRAMLKAYDETDRIVWVADSFQGLPRPDAEQYPADAGNGLWEVASLAIPLEEVKGNFDRYGLLDDQVQFLPGWFRDTIPAAPIEQLAILRLDGDLYESTIDVLDHLYPKLAPGGYAIIDDYRLLSCRKAVDDYRSKHEVREDLIPIDGTAVFWQKGPITRGDAS